MLYWKSFITMLVATGCGVSGLMASRTIEQDRDRKMTLMTTTFMPCGAKAPIIALFAGAIFGHSPLVAASAYFAGIASVILSGILLKKLRQKGCTDHFLTMPQVYQMSTKKSPGCLSRRRLGDFLFWGRLPDVYHFNFFTSKVPFLRIFSRFLRF